VTHVAVIAHTRKLPDEVRREFDDALFMARLDRTWIDVPKAKRARDAAAKAVANGCDVVVACGGDGTVRAASEALVGTDVPLAVLPVGTANLFATAYGLPMKPKELVSLLVAGQRRTIDSGVCNDKTFNVMAGAGLDARMIDDADEHKDRLGMLAYVRAGMAHAVGGNEQFDAQVAIDGEPVFAGLVTCVLVANIGTLKARVVAFPDASPADGLLDVGIVTASGPRQWAAVALDVVRRRPESSPHTLVRQGREIEISFDAKHRYQLDGGSKRPTDHLTFAVRPGALTLCAPAS
jgi:diacylglycerol kinase family enzyme